MKNLFTTLLFASILVLIPPSSFAKENSPSEVPVTMFKTDTAPIKPTMSECRYKTDLLEKAIKYTFCTNNLKEAMEKMEKSCNFYYAQNDKSIKNGTFDIHKLFNLKQLCDAKRIKITVTLAYDDKDKIVCKKNCKTKTKCKKDKKEFSFGLYKNITICELNKKFTSRQFKHNYLMKKHIIPLTPLATNNNSVQKFQSVVDMSQINNKSQPLYAVITFMDDCFKFKMKKDCRNGGNKCKNYAYLIEVEKIN